MQYETKKTLDEFNRLMVDIRKSVRPSTKLL